MIATVVLARRVRRRLPPAPRAPRSRTLEGLSARLPFPASLRARAQRRAAGAAQALLGRCAATACAGAFLVGSSVGGVRVPVAVAAGAWAGWRAAEEIWERSRRVEREAVRRAIPDALDRLTTGVLAGMSLERALRLAAGATPGRLGEALAAGLRALEVGVPRAGAYARIAERAGTDDVRRLVAALARAERLGTPVADVLLGQARDIRARLRAEAEAEANTAPVRLLFPTALCFLPAFLLLTVAPVVLSALKAFRTG